MWLLYRLKTNPKNIAEVRYHLISRLRPGNEYKIFAKGHGDDGAIIKLVPMSEEQVCNPHSRYEARLKQTEGSTEVLVGQKSVNKNQVLFHDDILRLANSDVRYKIMWQDVVFLKEGPEDDEYMSLMISGAEWGFNVVHKSNRLVTHMVIPASTQSNVSLTLLTSLMKNIPIVTTNWINDVFTKVDDRKFNMSALNAAITPVVWKEFGPLRRDVIFNGNTSRNKLFEHLNFIVLDQSQYSTLKFIIEACQGALVYHDLDREENLELNHNAMLITPNEEVQSHRKYHALSQEFREKTASEREIDKAEVGYAILYASTNYMCNPCATFSSLNLHSVSTTTTSDSSRPTLPYSGTGNDSDEDVDIKMEPTNQPTTEEIYDIAPNAHATSDPSLQYIETRSYATDNDQEEDYHMKHIIDSRRATCSLNAASLEAPIEEEEEEDDLSSLLGGMSDFLQDFANMGERKPPPAKKKSTTSEYIPSTSAVAAPITITSPPRAQSSNRTESPEFNLPPDPIAYTPYTRLTQTRREHSILPPPRLPTPPPQEGNQTPPPLPPQTINTKRRRIQFDEEDQDDSDHMSGTENNVPPPISEEIHQARTPVRRTIEEGNEKFTRYAFVPLVANPRPSAAAIAAVADTTSRRSTGGVNYKKFKKVRQFTHHNEMDIVHLVSSSERENTQRHSNIDNIQRFTSVPSQGIRLQETNEFDPELMIGGTRRRRR